MSEQIFTFKTAAVRTLISPYQNSKENINNEVIYYLLVNMKDLPANLPLDVNPREPKMTTNVAKSIIRAIKDSEEDFYINNRGIVISAKSFKSSTSSSEVTIDLGDSESEEDRATYGVLDGGHTYTAIINTRNELSEVEQFVRLEIITNVKNISRLSDARNTSVQVSDIALFNLDNQFEPLQKAIETQPYADKIAYKDNENKDINVAELLRLIYAFDIDLYPDDNNAPIQSYSGKTQVFKRFKIANETPLYKFLISQLPLLVTLYDKIQLEIPEKYKEYKEPTVKNPSFGSVRGIESIDSEKNKKKNRTPFKTLFFNQNTKYNISIGYIFPIFGAFRALLEKDPHTDTYKWSFDPIKVWDAVGKTIVQNVFESNIRNPQLIGKEKTVWLGNYRIVAQEKYRLEYEKIKKQLENQK